MARYAQELNCERSNPEVGKRRLKKKWNRKLIWYTPPFNLQVETDVGKEFFKILDKHFKGNELGVLFNRNSVKLRYSTTRNLLKIINSNNKKIIEEFEKKNSGSQKVCNCQKSRVCHLGGRCLVDNVIYKASVVRKIDN